MALFKLFKTPKNQKYDYQPRFWDPKKEDLDIKLSKYNKENKNNVDAVKSRLSKGIRKESGTYKSYGSEMRSKAVFRSNMILLATIVVLIFLTYIAFKIYVPGIVKALGQ